MSLLAITFFSALLRHTTSLTIKFVDYTKVSYSNPPIDDVDLDEISGLVWYRNNSNLFYAISDNLVENKGWIIFEYNSDSYEMTPITGTVLGDNLEGDPTNTDSESIAFLRIYSINDTDTDTDTDIDSDTDTDTDINDFYTQYLVISSEGHRMFNTLDHIMLYDLDGTYIKDFEYPSLFDITNTTGNQNNGGFEALDISSDYTTIAYTNERPLVQDNCDCSRIVVGTFDLPNNAMDTTDVELTNDYILRYDTEGDGWWITDLVLLDPNRFSGDNNAPVMPALILEGKRELPPTDYDIFLVDLNLGENDNVIDCFSLETDCPDAISINKKSVLDFSNTNFGDLDNDITVLNLESMAIYDSSEYSDNNNNDCIQTLILVNDNAEQSSTVWATFEINYCDDDSVKGLNIVGSYILISCAVFIIILFYV